MLYTSFPYSFGLLASLLDRIDEFEFSTLNDSYTATSVDRDGGMGLHPGGGFGRV